MIVEVVCDNPSHARGKVARIAEYRVEESGVSAYVGERARRAKRIKARADAGQLTSDIWDFWSHGNRVLPCKLCGQRLPADQQKLAAALRLCAREDRIVTITLSELRIIVSNQERL